MHSHTKSLVFVLNLLQNCFNYEINKNFNKFHAYPNHTKNNLLHDENMLQ